MREITAASSFLFLCGATAADAQAPELVTVGDAEVTVVRVTEPEPESSTFDRGLFVRAGGGLVVPVAGPLAQIGNVGAAGRVGAGVYLTPHLALLAEIELGHVPRGPDADTGYGFAAGAVGARGSVPTLEILHLFAEGTARVVMLGAEPGGRLELLEPSEVFGASIAFGLELDILEGLSAEGGLRLDYLATGDHWLDSSVPQGTGDTVTVSPFASASYFF